MSRNHRYPSFYHSNTGMTSEKIRRNVEATARMIDPFLDIRTSIDASTRIEELDDLEYRLDQINDRLGKSIDSWMLLYRIKVKCADLYTEKGHLSDSFNELCVAAEQLYIARGNTGQQNLLEHIQDELRKTENRIFQLRDMVYKPLRR